jgi:hypothetical protein
MTAPIDPKVSQYPQPLSPRRARFEARRAKQFAWRLPHGHPYARLPTWVPYLVAKLVAPLLAPLPAPPSEPEGQTPSRLDQSEH